MKMKKQRGREMKGEWDFSFLGEGISFDGSIQSKGTISIDGHVTGETSSVENLVVGKCAIVESNFDVSSAFLSGEIHGNIRACDRVEILSTGRVFGDVLSPVVMMEEGALLDGRCTVTPQSQQKRDIPDA